jgi:hypothetical protein
MPTRTKLIPIYTSHGDLGAFLLYPYIFSTQGEWIGWVTADRTVYSVHGHYVGILDQVPRILRKREAAYNQDRRLPPPEPAPIHPPTQVPLAPPLPEVANNMIDVLVEAPQLLPTVDFGELREDMD